MAERTPDGGGKAALLARAQILRLIPPGQDVGTLLQILVDDRILRRRLENSEEETWQLYHDFIADAIVALDRRKRKWALFLREADEEWRHSTGFLQYWFRLLSPSAQLKVFWHRLRERGFRFGEYVGFIRASTLRLVFNIYSALILASCLGACPNIQFQHTDWGQIGFHFGR
jgi:hypothetical protein